MKRPKGEPGKVQLISQGTASCRPSRRVKEFRNLGPEPEPLPVRATPPCLVRVVARPAYPKHLTELLDLEMRSQPVDQSERSISSATKSPVAFFRMVFSRSSLLIRALSA